MTMENKIKIANIAMIELIASHLEELCDDLVFLGGATTALLVDDEAAPDARATLDVDCIVDVISLRDYNKIERELRKKGFSQSQQDSVVCRWRLGEIILDVMPTNEKILGFSNKWYSDALKMAETISLPSGNEIKIVTPSYFLATKLEAFKSRGQDDYLGSHDLEDIISILDGRIGIVKEVRASHESVRQYIVSFFTQLLNTREFHDALPGHLNYTATIDERTELVWKKMRQIVE